MEKTIEKLIASIKEAKALKRELETNEEYWINLAEKEFGFIPEKGDWIHVDVSLYAIKISVYHNNFCKGVYWINGKWFNTPFPENTPII